MAISAYFHFQAWRLILGSCLWVQCDQIGRFIALWRPFKACGNNNFGQITHILGGFGKVVEIFNFASEIIFGQLL